MTQMLLGWLMSGLALCVLQTGALGVTVEFSSNLSTSKDHPFRPVRMERTPSGDFLILGIGDEMALPPQGPTYRPFPDKPTALVLVRVDGQSFQILSRTFLPVDPRVLLSPDQYLLTVDSGGSAWVGLTVRGGPFPALNPPIGDFIDSYWRTTTFLMKLSPDASALTYSAYVGCGGGVYASSLSAGPTNDLVLSGTTDCADFPVSSGAFQQTGVEGGFNGFVLKLQASTGAVRFGTYFGGYNQVNSPHLRAAATANGRVLLAATAFENPFPVSSGAYQETNPGAVSVYVGALSSDGSSLAFGSYFGAASGSVTLTDVLAGPDDSVTFLGRVAGGEIPLSPGAFRISNLTEPLGFVARISGDGKRLESSSTVCGGYGSIRAAILPDGDIVIAGNGFHTSTSEGAFSGDPLKALAGTLLLLRLSRDGTTMRFSSLYPSRAPMGPDAVLYLGAGKVLISGIATSGVLRSANAWVGTNTETVDTSSRGFLLAMDFDSPTRCAYAVESTPTRFPAGTSDGKLRVTTQSGCPWIASPLMFSMPEWPEIPGAIGPGELSITVPANLSASSRTIEIAAGSTIFPLFQEAATCDLFELSGSEIAFGPNGGGTEFRVSTPNGCTWLGGPSTAWFADLGNFQNDVPPMEMWGSHTIYASAPQNSFEARSGVLPLKDRVIPVTQAAGSCTSSVSPSSLQVPKAGGDFNLQLQTAGNNCLWQFRSGPGVRALLGNYGTGSATVPIRVEANPTNSSRETYFILANKRIPIVQAAGSCTASFSEKELVVPHVGGWRGTPFTATGDSCEWNPTTNASWIQFQAVNHGSATFYMTIEPNPGSSSRTAVIYNLGASLTVTQLGNDTAYILLNGPWKWPIKINGTDTTLNYEGSFAIGTTFTLEPLEWRFESASEITRITRWSDGSTPTRSLTLNTTNTNLTLESESLRRIAVETVNGGKVDLKIINGRSVEKLPEFYATQSEFGSLFVQATAVAEPGYRFVGWILNPQNGYSLQPMYPYSPVNEWFMRPRFERLVSPTGPHSVPETLEFVEYPTGPAVNRYMEVRGLNSPSTGLEVEGICPGGLGLLTSVAVHPMTSDRSLVSFVVSRDRSLELGKGVHHCSLALKQQDRLSLSIPMTLRIEGVPAKTAPPPATGGIAAITNAATFAVKPISPGGLFTAFGTELASGTANAESIPLPELLKEAQIRLYSSVDYVERYAGLLYVSPLQINFYVPEDLPLGSAEVRFYRNGQRVSTTPVQVVKSSPGVFWVPIFNGSPVPAGYGTRVSGSNQYRTEIYDCPAGQQGCNLHPPDFGQPGDELFLSLYATGLRGLRKTDIRVFAGSVELPVDYLGPQGFFVGLDQVNVRVPRSLAGTGVHFLEMQTPSGIIEMRRVQF